MGEKKRVNVTDSDGKEIKVTQMELDSMMLIRNKQQCATQACNPNSIPDNTPVDKATAYFAGAMSLKAEANTLEKLWWDEMIKRYSLQGKGNVHLDFSDGSLFNLIEE